MNGSCSRSSGLGSDCIGTRAARLGLAVLARDVQVGEQLGDAVIVGGPVVNGRFRGRQDEARQHAAGDLRPLVGLDADRSLERLRQVQAVLVGHLHLVAERLATRAPAANRPAASVQSRPGLGRRRHRLQRIAHAVDGERDVGQPLVAADHFQVDRASLRTPSVAGSSAAPDELAAAYWAYSGTVTTACVSMTGSGITSMRIGSVRASPRNTSRLQGIDDLGQLGRERRRRFRVAGQLERGDAATVERLNDHLACLGQFSRGQDLRG